MSENFVDGLTRARRFGRRAGLLRAVSLGDRGVPAPGSAREWWGLRRSWLAGCVACLALLSGCSEASPADPIPAGVGESSSETGVPDDRPAWEADFTAEQLATYREADRRWQAFLKSSRPVLAKGTNNAAGRAVYREYATRDFWEEMAWELHEYDRLDVQVIGGPSVYWSRPTRVTSNSVTIEECVDYTAGKGVEKGEEAAEISWADVPRQRIVTLLKEDGEFRISSRVDAWTSNFGPRPERCKP